MNNHSLAKVQLFINHFSTIVANSDSTSTIGFYVLSSFDKSFLLI